MKNHPLKLVLQTTFKTKGTPKILQKSGNAQHNIGNLRFEKLQRKGSLSGCSF